MSTREELVLARLPDAVVTLDTLTRSPELSLLLRHAVEQAVIRHLVTSECTRRGLTASTEELQAAADVWRKSKRLHRADATHEWLSSNGFSVDDLESEVRFSVLLNKLREHLARPQVEQYFHEHKAAYDAVVVGQIVVETQSQASEILAQLQEDEADFESLARKHSIDRNTAPAGGFVGAISRGARPPEIDSKLFSARAGDVLGPFETAGRWTLIKVLEIQPARLDDATRIRIADQIFSEWLGERRSHSKVEWMLR